MEGLRAYNCFMALKLHFTSDYDYFRYSGKVRPITPEKFSARKDSHAFQRIERRYGENLERFLVSNFVLNKDAKWVRNLGTVHAEDLYRRWNEHMTSLSSLLERDLLALKYELSDLLTPKAGGHPPLLKEYLAEKIDLFTLIMMNEVFDLISMWNNRIRDTVIWPDVSRLITKTRPFLQLSMPEIKNVIRKIYLDNQTSNNYTDTSH